MSGPDFISDDDKQLAWFWFELTKPPPPDVRLRSNTCPASFSGSKELTQQNTESPTAQDEQRKRVKAYLGLLNAVGVSNNVLHLQVIALRKLHQKQQKDLDLVKEEKEKLTEDLITTDEELEKLEAEVKEKEEVIEKKDLCLDALMKELVRLGSETDKWKMGLMIAKDELDKANAKVAEMQNNAGIMNLVWYGCLLGWKLGRSASDEEVKKLRDEISLGQSARDEEVKKLRDEIERLNVRNSSPQENQSNEDSEEQNATSTEEDESEGVAKKKLKTEQPPTK